MTDSPPAQEKMMEWQPIETAPKDGTPILVCRVGYQAQQVAAVYWDWTFSRRYPWQFLTIADGHAKGWPTHWMPLPPPPTQGTPDR